jgi:hypothetical protein
MGNIPSTPKSTQAFLALPPELRQAILLETFNSQVLGSLILYSPGFHIHCEHMSTINNIIFWHRREISCWAHKLRQLHLVFDADMDFIEKEWEVQMRKLVQELRGNFGESVLGM